MKKLVKCCSAIVWFGTSAAGVHALDRDEVARIAVKHMARETVECAAYFDIVSLVLLRADKGATSHKYVEARKLAVARADSLSAGIVNAQYNNVIIELTNKIAMANIPKQIDKGLSNVSIGEIEVLQNQYGKLCKEVLNEPGKRTIYWMDRAGGSAP